MTFRDIPRDIKDEKDMESFHRALREKAVSITSHSELKNIEGADKSSTDTSKNKHVSDYDLKKIEDHMDDDSKHIGETLAGSANYLKDITGSGDAVVSGTGTTRNVAVVVTDATLQTSDITTNDVSTSKHGLAPKAPGDATKFLNGANPPAYAVPASATYTGGKNIVVTSTVIDQVLEYGASAYRAGFQTITTSTWTKIQFDSLTVPYLDNDFDPLTNNDYLAPVAGYYHVDILAGINSLADGAEARVAIYVNGTIVPSYNNAYSPNAAASPRVFISKDLLLAANDHVEGYIWHDHGSNRSTISDAMYMTVHYMG